MRNTPNYRYPIKNWIGDHVGSHMQQRLVSYRMILLTVANVNIPQCNVKTELLRNLLVLELSCSVENH